MKLKFYLQIFAICSCWSMLINKSSAQTVSVKDSLVLIDLIKLRAPNQGYAWPTLYPVNTWKGVVIKNGRVSELILPFSTKLPKSIGSLDSLSVLNVDSRLYDPYYYPDTLPVSFWRLHNLRVLSMQSCRVFGVLSDSISKLSKLTYLNLSGNYQLGFVSPAIRSLTNLQYLNLYNCSLSAMPSLSNKLSKLEYIDLSKNSISGNIASVIDSLPRIKVINLQSNNFMGPLTQVNWSYFSALQKLLLSNNNFADSIPSSLALLPALDTISLDNNRLTNVNQLKNLNSLSVINIANNYLTFDGVETLAKKFIFITYSPQKTLLLISYNSNSLSVTAGGTLANNTYYWYMNDTLVSTITGDSTLSNPQDEHYTVKVTNAIANLLTLTNLDVPRINDSLALVALYDSLGGKYWGGYGTSFTPWNLKAPINSWSRVEVKNGRVTALRLNDVMYRAANYIYDPYVPQAIGLLTGLKYLDMSNNPLIVRHLPATFGNLRHLETLKMSYSAIDSFPTSISRLSRLKYLDLNSGIRGAHNEIPAEIGNLVNLEYLDLSNISLTGIIPSAIGNLTQLKYLILDNNNFSRSSFPAFISNLTNLQTLKLQNDSITGNLPGFITALPKLNALWLDNNSLTGNIPSFSKGYACLHLVKNKFTGSLPNGLSADSIDFSYNQLTGVIPSDIKCSGFLNLGYNKLTGYIPESLGSQATFQVFLNNNQLTGSIPSSFNYEHFDMDQNHVGVVDLSFNNLTGTVPLLDKFFIPNLYYDYSTDSYRQQVAYMNLSYNLYNFSGIVNGPAYNYQKNLPLYKQGNILYMMAGDTLANDTFRLFRNGVLVQAHLGDSAFKITTAGKYNITARNRKFGSFTLYTDTLLITGDSLILPARPNTLIANAEITDTAGWTNYYYNNNTPNDITDDTLLLSIKKNGQNIGTIGDGTFEVKLSATAGAGSNTGIFLSSPLITNTSGYWVMNRYWHVNATTQPSVPVGVRFYYNNQDVADVNGSYPSHDLHKDSLLFYKAVGGDPDPTTGLIGATDIISILPGSAATTTTYTYHAISDTTQYAEYMVASFSGGGGGGTGNKQALPVTLTNLTAKNNFKTNLVSWQTTQEVNSAYFDVQKSTDNNTFNSIGTVAAKGNSSITSSYAYTDLAPAAGNNYYRLKIVDKDGQYSYSRIVLVKNNGGAGISMYPNPAKASVQVSLAGMATGKYNIIVYNANGKALLNKTVTVTTGNQTITLPVGSYAGGVYTVTITDDKGQLVASQKVAKE